MHKHTQIINTTATYLSRKCDRICEKVPYPAFYQNWVKAIFKNLDYYFILPETLVVIASSLAEIRATESHMVGSYWKQKFREIEP